MDVGVGRAARDAALQQRAPTARPRLNVAGPRRIGSKIGTQTHLGPLKAWAKIDVAELRDPGHCSEEGELSQSPPAPRPSSRGGSRETVTRRINVACPHRVFGKGRIEMPSMALVVEVDPCDFAHILRSTGMAGWMVGIAALGLG